MFTLSVYAKQNFQATITQTQTKPFVDQRLVGYVNIQFRN
jgi:hypothetical protein